MIIRLDDHALNVILPQHAPLVTQPRHVEHHPLQNFLRVRARDRVREFPHGAAVGVLRARPEIRPHLGLGLRRTNCERNERKRAIVSPGGASSRAILRIVENRRRPRFDFVVDTDETDQIMINSILNTIRDTIRIATTTTTTTSTNARRRTRARCTHSPWRRVLSVELTDAFARVDVSMCRAPGCWWV